MCDNDNANKDDNDDDCMIVVHLWKYKDGYPGLDNHKAILRSNEVSPALLRDYFLSTYIKICSCHV